MSLFDLLVTHVWWRYGGAGGWSAAYHWFNLVEALVWFVFGGFVLARFLRQRRSAFELIYALAFVTFGLSDLREAWQLESWLLLAKGVNLGLLLALRRHILRRYYPQSKVY